MTAKPLPDVAFHWSPRKNRADIQALGLLCRDGGITRSKWTVCMSPTAEDAWSLLGSRRIEHEWDLWEVRVPTGAFWRADGYPEIRTFTDIPASAVQLVLVQP